jgi:hypothetical protein
VVVSVTIDSDECPLIIRFAKALEDIRFGTFVKTVTVDAMRTPARKAPKSRFTGQDGRG